MINILIIFLVVATLATVLYISMCKMIKDADRRVQEIKQNMLNNKVMANAEPGNYRCCMCGKKFTDGGTFKVYENKWYCINCYHESFIKKVKAHFLEERKKQAESEKAGEK